MATLAPNEAAVVREFVLRQAAAELPLNDPAVTTLLEDGVLARVGTFERRDGTLLLWHLRLTEVAENNLDPKALGLAAFLPEGERGRRYSWRELLFNALPQESQEWAMAQRPGYLMPKRKPNAAPQQSLADSPYLQ